MNETMNSLADNRAFRIASVAAISILALFLLVKTVDVLGQVGDDGMPPSNVITVSGTGTASMVPDIAKITFSVTQEASTVAAAQDGATKQANAALAAVEEEGIDEKDIKTVSYNISPLYSNPRPCPIDAYCVNGGTPQIYAYQVSQTVQVTVRDLEQVSPLLTALGQLNVQNLYGPEFALDDSSAAQNAARAEAIEEAKAQAEILADQLGVDLVRIVSFSDSSAYPMYYGKAYGGVAMDMAQESRAASNPSVPTGENEYTAQVSITYEIR